MSNWIIGFTARREGGKSLAMTAKAYFMMRAAFTVLTRRLEDRGYSGRDLFSRQQAWRPQIISNYWVSFADRYEPDMASFLSSFPEEAFNSLILIDELTGVAPRGRGMATTQILLAEMATQIRKWHINIMHTCQNPDRAGHEILRQTDIMMEPYTPDKGKSVYLSKWDQWGQWTGRYSKGLWPQDRPPDARTAIMHADAFWPDFNTEETVLPYLLHKQLGERAKTRAMAQDAVGEPVSVKDRESTDAEIIKLMTLGLQPDASYQALRRGAESLGLDDGALRRRLATEGWAVEKRGQIEVLVRAGA